MDALNIKRRYEYANAVSREIEYLVLASKVVGCRLLAVTMGVSHLESNVGLAHTLVLACDHHSNRASHFHTATDLNLTHPHPLRTKHRTRSSAAAQSLWWQWMRTNDSTSFESS